MASLKSLPAPSTHLPDHLGNSLFEGPVPQIRQRWLWDLGHPSQGIPHCPRWHDSGGGAQGLAHCTAGFNPGQETLQAMVAPQGFLGDQGIYITRVTIIIGMYREKKPQFLHYTVTTHL
jgi:hypothetical protein